MKPRAVVLVSGGLDSATCLVMAKMQGYDCYALTFDYGQRSHSELAAAQNIAKQHGAILHKTATLSLGELSPSALTNTNIDVPNFSANGNIPVTYVPARNTVFLSIALGWAETLNASAIFIGVSSVDYSGYPDCRPEYIDAFQNLANLATKAGIEGKPIRIFTPLINLSKAETIKAGSALGIDYSRTVTCYQANDQGQACGHCDSCELRRRGFQDAGLNDPTHYVEAAVTASGVQ